MYPSDAERVNWDIYDDFKLNKTLSSHGLNKYFSVVRGKVDLGSDYQVIKRCLQITLNCV